ncbi:uroporphyrinogen decarboxylase family protein [Planctomycetota bacterium]
MNAAQRRVLSALAHQPPDRIGVYDTFWRNTEAIYREAFAIPAGQSLAEYFDVDVQIVIPDEMPFPSRAGVVEDRPSEVVRVDGWGRTVRALKDGYFYDTLDVAIKSHADLDRVEFESPALDSRYEPSLASLEARKARFCCFTKTGGPFLRTCFLRGEEDFLIDIAADPDFAKALADRTADHLVEIGLESLRRFDLCENGVWIFDDMCSNEQPMMSPSSFERVFLPAYRRMVATWKAAGARFVVLHCDGNLDMLVDAGIDGINPVEPKAGMDLVALKRRYGKRLAYIGGMCNAHVLPSGDLEAVRRQTLGILDAGRDGGVLIGAHSIGPDIAPETYRLYRDLVAEHGRCQPNPA